MASHVLERGTACCSLGVYLFLSFGLLASRVLFGIARKLVSLASHILFFVFLSYFVRLGWVFLFGSSGRILRM